MIMMYFANDGEACFYVTYIYSISIGSIPQPVNALECHFIMCTVHSLNISNAFCKIFGSYETDVEQHVFSEVN